MANQYYYFIAGLPSISLDDTKLVYPVSQFRDDAAQQLSTQDMALIGILHLPDDLQNLLNIIYNEGRDPNPEGLISADTWQEYHGYLRAKLDNNQLSNPFKSIPDFVEKVLIPALQMEELPKRSKIEHDLLNELFSFAASHPNSFIRQWFDLDRQIKNILVAINARNHEMEYAQYLIGEDEAVQNLSKSHAADFGMGKENPVFESIQRIWEQNNILYRERGYDIYRAKWIDQQTFFEYFNIDRILGYYSKLRLINRWLTADANMGKEVFHDTLDKLENSFAFPEDFNIKIKQK